jgi:hypothetical protein
MLLTPAEQLVDDERQNHKTAHTMTDQGETLVAVAASFELRAQAVCDRSDIRIVGPKMPEHEVAEIRLSRLAPGENTAVDKVRVIHKHLRK